MTLPSSREASSSRTIRTRADALRAGAEVVDALDAFCRQANVGMVAVGRGRVSLPRALTNALAPRLADALRNPGPIAPTRAHRPARVRSALKRAALKALYGRRLRALPPSSSLRVLAVLRQENHFHEVMPALEAARAMGIESTLLLFREQHLRYLDGWSGGVLLAGDLARGKATAVDGPRFPPSMPAPPRVLPDEWERLLALSGSYLRAHAEDVGAAAAALDAALARVRPRLVVLGNPCTMEGRLAAMASAADSIPTLAVQHGTLHEGDPLWRSAVVDRVCAWGVRSRDALLSSGLGEERVMVTGSPRVGSAHHRARGVDAAPPLVLVALSGAGHTVDAAEHAATVERIVAAMDLSRGRWCFRLHPKDDLALYRRILTRHRVPEAEILPAAPHRPSIARQLESAAVLVTVGSTAALDAMLAHVPVITLARPKGEPIPDFVLAGATTHVDEAGDLRAAVARVVAEGESASVTQAARAYVEAFYGPRDGRAAERVAEEIRALASRVT